jgi:multiple sugar transport system permease protein
MAAAMILALVPVCIFFSYIQKFIVQGLTAGALKG